jgi:hypothetical protein
LGEGEGEKRKEKEKKKRNKIKRKKKSTSPESPHRFSKYSFASVSMMPGALRSWERARDERTNLSCSYITSVGESYTTPGPNTGTMNLNEGEGML